MTVPDLDTVATQLKTGKALLIDVREQDEWDEAHLPGAQLVSLSRLENDDIPKDLPRDKTLYTYCRRGIRAVNASTLLGLDYPTVIALPYPFTELQERFGSSAGETS